MAWMRVVLTESTHADEWTSCRRVQILVEDPAGQAHRRASVWHEKDCRRRKFGPVVAGELNAKWPCSVERDIDDRIFDRINFPAMAPGKNEREVGNLSLEI